MKKIIVFLVIPLISISLFILSFNCDEKPVKQNIIPKINDCYMYQFKGNNPFKSYRIDTIKILDVKGNYLKYKQNDGFISSDEIDYIMKYAIKTDSCNCL
jgi:hypothetical protein